MIFISDTTTQRITDTLYYLYEDEFFCIGYILTENIKKKLEYSYISNTFTLTVTNNIITIHNIHLIESNYQSIFNKFNKFLQL